MKRYFASIKQYSWILLACILVAAVVGYFLSKSQLTVYNVSSGLLVQEGAPGTTYPGGPAGGTAADSLAKALNYSAELQTLSIMQYVLNHYPELQKHGYTANDLILDVVPSTATTTATITLLAAAAHPDNAVMLANDVANGFVAYNQSLVQSQLSAKRTALMAQIAAAQQAKTGWEAKLESLPNNTDPHFIVYNNNIADDTRTIDTANAQLNNLPTTVLADVSVIQPATAKDVTTSTKGYIIMGVSAGVGLLVGIMIMLLLIFLDNRLRNVEQVKEKLGMAYLGGLSDSKEVRESATQVQGAAQRELADIAANLRLTGVLPGAWQAPQGAILLITSPQIAEGKTTLVAGLSAALARAGVTVLVVDGNLRQPATHLAFGMNGTGPGLSGLLKGMGRGNVDDAVMRCNVPGVWLLSGGDPMEDATIMMEQRLPDILKQLRTKVDVVIIDGPALLSGADASVLAGMADGVALVIDARHEKLPLLLRTKELLNSLTRTPAGIIMNRVARSKHNNYYASAYISNRTSATPDMWVPVPAPYINMIPEQSSVPLLPAQSSATSAPYQGNVPMGMPPISTIMGASVFPSNKQFPNRPGPSPLPRVSLPGYPNDGVNIQQNGQSLHPTRGSDMMPPPPSGPGMGE